MASKELNIDCADTFNNLFSGIDVSFILQEAFSIKSVSQQGKYCTKRPAKIRRKGTAGKSSRHKHKTILIKRQRVLSSAQSIWQ